MRVSTVAELGLAHSTQLLSATRFAIRTKCDEPTPHGVVIAPVGVFTNSLASIRLLDCQGEDNQYDPASVLLASASSILDLGDTCPFGCAGDSQHREYTLAA